MTQQKITTIESLRDCLPTITREIAKHGICYKILQNNKPLGVFLNYQDYQNLLDNLMELSDADLISSIQEAREEFSRGGGKLLEEIIKL